MIRLSLACLAVVMFATVAPVPVVAQRPPANYDESQVGSFQLPDPLVLADGKPVRDAETWRSQRRGELLRLFESQMYGRTPGGKPEKMRATVKATATILNGKATRKEIEVSFSDSAEIPRLTMLVYLPRSDRPVPAFLGLNFGGNHAVDPDPAVTLNPGWFRDAKDRGYVDHRATEKSRGGESSRWPIELIVSRGYALATACYTDLDPDFDDGFQNGIHPLFYRPGQTKPAPDEWGAIGAWAWGMSRMLDCLADEPAIDTQRVAAIGHSRLGKTALWCGAQDERFALVISNNSGEGGASLMRRNYGETIEVLNRSFPHWFCDNFNQYDQAAEKLPIDAHELIALIAPRPVYIASAVEDRWADPRGEFLAGYYAQPVYELLGKPGLLVTSDATPAVDQPVKTGTIGYHLRAGKHDVTTYDWQQYLDFADRHLGGKK